MISFKCLWLFVIIFITITGTIAGNAGAESLSIGRMRVAIWPEYDNPGALVVYDGRFTDPTSFPAKSRFFIPKDIVISDACSLSPNGQHFCQIFKIRANGDWNEIELWLPFPNFYLSFHLPHTDMTTAERKLDYRIKSNHPIETMEVDIQQPLRASHFSIALEPGLATGTESVKEGFQHFNYTLNNIAQGDEQVFALRYQKADIKPSIDIKYASMTGTKIWGSPYDDQKKASKIITIVFGTGVSVLGIIGFLFWQKRKKAS